MSRSKRRRSASPTAALAAALVLTLLAPPGAAAKKKKETSALSGVVENRAGEPLVDVRVTLNAASGSEFTGTAKTDKNGEFSVEVPAEGSYLLRLEKEGYAPLEKTTFLVLGEEHLVQVQMLNAAEDRRNEAVRAYNEGAKAYQAKDMATAKERFLAATAGDPSIAEPFLVLADIYLVEGAHREAADAAEKYLALKPGDQKGQMLAYEAYQKLGDQAKVDELRAALGKTDAAPQLAIQTFNEGAIANQEGDLDKAIEKFQSALGLDPDLAEAHAALAAIYYNQERYDEALAGVEKALALNPEHVTSHRVRFLILDAKGDRASADKAMASYVAVDSKGAVGLLYKRADLDFRDGQPQLARAGLLKVLELDPDMARAHYTLGLIYASDDTAKAKEHFEKFIELAPDDPEVATAKEMMSYF